MSTALPILKDVDSKISRACRRGFGCLQAADPNDVSPRTAAQLNLPLAAVDVKAVVADRLAHVTIEQSFHNPYSDHLEAVYIFPLAGGAVVSQFVLKVQGRVVDGVVLERQEARAQYTQAIEAGRQAAMVEQERDNIFTVQVGNLPPGEDVSVTLSYSEKLPYFDAGTTELRLPLVVAERFIGGEMLERDSVGDGVASDTTGVADASRITPPRLAKGASDGLALTLAVTIEDATKIADLSSSQHANQIGFEGSSNITVSLARTDEKMDRDFILRWRLASDHLQSNVLVYDKQFAMLSLLPPRADEFVRPARDVLFVIDRSGSMQGEKMASAARACSYLLDTLGPEDRFGVQIFDTEIDWMEHDRGQYFYAADVEQLEKGQKYLRAITARGGTDIELAVTQGIKAFKALSDNNKDSDTALRLPVLVLLTDGQVGNEPAVYREIQESAGDIRIFTVGIDTAVNDAFLNRLANLGGGTAAFVAPGAQMQNALAVVGREIGCPILTNLQLSAQNCSLIDCAPATLPELFEGRAASIFFNLAGVGDIEKAHIKVTAKYADGGDFACDVPLKATDVKALPQLWAKERVVDLEDEFRLASNSDRQKLKQNIIDIACKHSILTKFTAFVAVDAVVVNKDGSVRKVVQPVATPAMWEESTFDAAPMAGAWGAAPAFAPEAAKFGSPAAGAGGWGSSTPVEPNTLAGSIRARLAQSQSEPEGADSFKQPPSSAPLPQMPASSWAVPQPLPPASPMVSTPPTPPSNGSGFSALIGNILPVLKRKGGQVSEPGPKANTPSSNNGDVKKLKACYDRFALALHVVLDLVIAGRVPSSEQLGDVGKLRGELLTLLNQSNLSACVDLQRYLKADMPVLLGALSTASQAAHSPRPKTQKLAESHKANFEAIDKKFVERLCAESLSFWEVSV
jgi:Ca-activated chloride channel family protein